MEAESALDVTVLLARASDCLSCSCLSFWVFCKSSMGKIMYLMIPVMKIGGFIRYY